MSKKTITVLLAALMPLSVGTASFASEDFLTDNEIPIVSGVQVESGASEESIKEETAIFPKATENTEEGIL